MQTAKNPIRWIQIFLGWEVTVEEASNQNDRIHVSRSQDIPDSIRYIDRVKKIYFSDGLGGSVGEVTERPDFSNPQGAKITPRHTES